ncbi:MAG: Adenosine deaminase [uncultured Thermomicrobiales bacterium]|uniref:Adenosine deaminase n=1 Tax=uncultured Thermomicrobiales bacterium TaxID=1645740 RepID=A0A6J4VLH3_9BACT|nr:MAG: Adenosine deaminase [uncultured Thermomicrobiales bacterium]
MSLDSYVRAAPKAELHVHLEGAIRPATLLALARRNGVSLPATDVDGLRRWFIYRDFPHFIEIYVAITRCLRTADDYELIVHELGAELAAQNARYAEVTFTPGTHRSLGVPEETWFRGIARGRERALADFDVEIAWVFDIARSAAIDFPERGLTDYTVGVAIEGMADGVVALGLGGLEAGYPPQPFAPAFDRARAAGLRSAPHAGELAGPASIWGALTALGADRIGHGVRAIEDPALVAHLAEHRIPIEVCPTSNLRLGVFPDLARHPLPPLLDAGVVLTVNSDDPPLFNTTLTEELALLPGAFGLGVAAIDRVLLDAVRHSFLPPPRRDALATAFADQLAALKAIHLDAAGARPTVDVSP